MDINSTPVVRNFILNGALTDFGSNGFKLPIILYVI
jgi:hypothetical protein